jgi:hypothetical protein
MTNETCMGSILISGILGTFLVFPLLVNIWIYNRYGRKMGAKKAMKSVAHGVIDFVADPTARHAAVFLLNAIALAAQAAHMLQVHLTNEPRQRSGQMQLEFGSINC